MNIKNLLAGETLPKTVAFVSAMVFQEEIAANPSMAQLADIFLDVIMKYEQTKNHFGPVLDILETLLAPPEDDTTTPSAA